MTNPLNRKRKFWAPADWKVIISADCRRRKHLKNKTRTSRHLCAWRWTLKMNYRYVTKATFALPPPPIIKSLFSLEIHRWREILTFLLALAGSLDPCDCSPEASSQRCFRLQLHAWPLHISLRVNSPTWHIMMPGLHPQTGALGRGGEHRSLPEQGVR